MEWDHKKKISSWKVCLLLALPLVMLFHKSIRPEQVLFSNDGPLGVISAEAGSLPETFQGYWHDLNWVGMENPSALPDFSMLLGWVIDDPVTYSKVYAPSALLFLGLSAWLMARTLKWHPWVCLMVGLAAALNANAFSNACWGLPSRATTLASVFLALAALHADRPRSILLRLMLAGFAIGHGIMEGFDVGALYSVGFGIYLTYALWVEKGPSGRGVVTGLGSLIVVVMAAAWMASQGLLTLVGTQLAGSAPSDPSNPAEAEAQWHFATQWSLPPSESLRMIIPGAFGYRMTDLNGNMEPGSYWGGVGRDPRWSPGMAAVGLMRHSGSGEYAGLLVIWVGLWAFCQTFRRQNMLYPEANRRLIRFWMGLALVSTLLAFGRHTPIYQGIYSLPFFHTMRNPIKFMHLTHLAWIVLFGYGLQGLCRQLAAGGSPKSESMLSHLKAWWPEAGLAEKRWTKGFLALSAVAIMSWLIYASSGSEMSRYLQTVGIPASISASIHGFSAKEVGFFVLLLLVTGSLWTLAISGYLQGRKVTQWMWVMAVVFALDMARANQPWIQYYDYQDKYATHPILDILKDNPHEARVTSTLNPFAVSSLVNQQGAILPQLYNDWLQHAFPFHNIQSLDIIQWPRPPQMDRKFGRAFAPTSNDDLDRYTRLWTLTSTRYILGMAGYLPTLNQSFDPGRERFSIHSAFQFTPKAGRSIESGIRADDLTTTLSTNGPFAIFEFEGALPRAALFHDWRSMDSDEAILNTLSNPDFDPSTTVLLESTANLPSPPTKGADGFDPVSDFSYSPRRIDMNTENDRTSLLLLNDRFHPDWHVYVDEQETQLLRCNALMRGVFVSAGKHQVSFRYEPSTQGLRAALLAWLVAAGILLMACFRRPLKD